MGSLFRSAPMSERRRKAPRKKIGARAWIRPEGGFAVRPCNVIDLSDTGVQIMIEEAASVPSNFTFLTSRNDGLGRRARIKWRRESKIGAEFL